MVVGKNLYHIYFIMAVGKNVYHIYFIMAVGKSVQDKHVSKLI
jgi:hypothetical protein